MNRQLSQTLQRLVVRLKAHDHVLGKQLQAPAQAAAVRPWLQRTARSFTALYIFQTLLIATPALGQLVAAPGAGLGQKPLIDAAANGVPIVHIAPPSAGGVSRNQFEQFNIPTNGLILNNSNANVQTQLGGLISGNLQLGRTPARLIVNEVTGINASQLRGTLEVAGQRADIVIANPNGILCDGCGFLNTNGRATLVTGQAQYGANGTVLGFNVNGGSLQVGPKGLNAANQEQLDLIARGLVIEGAIWAQNLNVLAGSNQVLYGTLKAVPQAGGGSAPQFAIDIKQLGGMYANQIYMLATDKGLGVNSTGRMAALQGNLQLSADGNLTLRDTQAVKNIQLHSGGSIELTGQTLTEQNLQVQAPKRFVNRGQAQADQLNLQATRIENSGTLMQLSKADLLLQANEGLINSGVVQAAGNLRVQASSVGSLTTDSTAAAGNKPTVGQMLAGGALSLESTNVDLSAQRLQANTDLRIDAQSIRIAASNLQAGGQLRISAAGPADISATTLVADGGITVTANQLTADKSNLSSSSRIDLTATARLVAGGAKVASTGPVTIQANQVDIANSSVSSAASIRATALGELRVTATQLLAGDSVEFAGVGITTAGSTVSAAAVQLDAGSGQLNNQAGRVLATGNSPSSLVVRATGINNTGGQLTTNGGLTIDARGGSLDNTGGVLAGQRGDMQNLGSLANARGQLYIDSDLSLSGTPLTNAGGVIASAGSVFVDTRGQTLDNQGGTIQAGGTLSLRSGAANLQSQAGKLIAGSDLTIQADTLDIRNAGVQAGGSIVVSGGQVLAMGSTLVGSRTLNVTAQGDANLTGATLVAGGPVAIQGASTSMNQASVNTTGDLAIRAQDLYATGSRLSSDGAVSLTATSQTQLAGATVSAAGALSLQGLDANLNQAKLVSGGALSLNSTSLSATGARLSSLGDTRIVVRDMVDLSQTSVISGGGLVVQASTVSVAQGTLSAVATADIATSELRANAASITTSGKLKIQVLGNADLSNTTVSAIDNIVIQASTTQANQAVLKTNGDLTLTSGTLAASNAQLSSQGNLRLTTQGATDLSGASANSGGLMALEAAAVNVNQAALSAVGTLRVNSTELRASGARLASSDAVTLTAQGNTTLASANVSAAGNIAVQGTLVDASQASLRTAGGLTVRGTQLVATSADFSSTKAMSLTVQSSADVSGARLSAGGDLGVRADTVQAKAALASSGGDLTIAAAQLNGGDWSAQGNVDVITAGATDLAGGGLRAGRAVTVNANGITTGGASISGQTIALGAGQGSLNNVGGRIVASGTGASALSVNAQGITNTAGGVLASAGGAVLNANGQALDNRGGTIQAIGALQITASEIRNRGGSLSTGGSLTFTGQAVDNQDGTLQAGGNLTITTAGQALDNTRGRLLAQGNVTLAADSLLSAGGTVAANGNTKITVATLDNTGGRISGGRQLDAQVTNQLSTASGSLASGGATTVSAGGIDGPGAVIESARQLKVTTVRDLDLRAAQLSSQESILLTAGGAADLSGARASAGGALTLQADTANISQANISAVDALTINTNQLQATDAKLVTAAAMNLNVQGNTQLAGSTLAADGALAVNSAGTIDATSALVSTGSTLDIRGSQLAASGARFVSHADSQLLSQRAANLSSAQLTSGGKLTLQATDTNLNQASVNARGALAVTATTLQAARAKFATSGALSIASSGNANLTSAALVAVGDIAFSSQALRASNSRVVTDGTLRVTATQVQASGAQLLSAQALSLATPGDADLTGAQLSAGQNLDIRAANISADAARVTSGADLSVAASQLQSQAGQWSAQTNASVLATGAVSLADARLTAGQALTVQANGINTNGARVGADTINLNATAGTFNNALGRVIATGTAGTVLTVQARGIDNSGGVLSSAGSAVVNANAQALNNQGGTIQTAGALQINASQLLNRSGTVLTGGLLAIAGQAFDNQNGVLQAGGSLTLNTAGQTLTNTRGRIVADGDVTLTTGDLRNANGLVASNSRAVLTTAALDNTAGQIVGIQQLTVQAAGALSTADGSMTSLGSTTVAALSVAGERAVFESGAALQITSTQGAALNAARLSAQGNLALAAGGPVLLNSATVQANGSVRVTSSSLSATSSTFSAGGDLQLISSTGAANLAKSSLLSGASLSVQAVGITTTQAKLSAVQDLTVLAGTGDISARNATFNSQTGSVSVSGAAIDASADTPGTAAFTAAKNLQITATGNLNLANVSSIAGQNLAVSAQGQLNNSNGLMAAGQQASVVAEQGLNNQNGIIDANGNLTLQISQGALDNTNGRLTTRGSLALTAPSGPGAALANAGGTIQSAGALNLALGQLDNQGGEITTLGSLTISGGPVNNAAGLLAARGDLTINTNNGAFDSRQGQLVSEQGSVAVTAGTGIAQLTDMQLFAKNDVRFQAGQIIWPRIRLQQAGDVSLVSGNGLDLTAAQISGRNLTLSAGAGLLNNAGGTLQAAGTANISGTGVNNQRGSVIANGSLTVNGASGVVDNSGGKLISTQGAVYAGGADIRNAANGSLAAGTLQSATDMTLYSTRAIDNTASLISAGGNLSISGPGAVANSGGRLVSGGSAVLSVGAVDNNSGSIRAASTVDISTSGALSNTGGDIQSGAGLAVRSAGGIYSQQGTLQAANDVWLDAGNGDLNLSNATVAAGSSLQASGGAAYMAASSISAGGNATFNTASIYAPGTTLNVGGALTVTTGNVDLSSSSIKAGQGASLSGNSMDLRGTTLHANGAVKIAGGSIAANNASLISTQDKVTIDATVALDLSNGLVKAGTALAITGDNLGLQGSTLQAATSARLIGKGISMRGANLLAGGDVQVEAADINASSATVQSTAGQVSITAVNAVDAVNAVIKAGTDLLITSGDRVDLSGSTLRAVTTATVTGKAVQLRTADLLANDNVVITGTSIDAGASSIGSAAGSVSLVATGALNLAQAKVEASQDVTTSGGAGSSTAGARLLAGRDLSVTTTDRIDFNSGSAAFQAGRDLTLVAQGINTAGQDITAANIRLDAGLGSLDNTGGKVQATGTLTTISQGINNQGGTLMGNQNVTIDAGTQGIDNRGGQIYSALAATDVKANYIDNSGAGAISAQTDLTLTAISMNNRTGKLQAGQNAIVTLTDIFNNDAGQLKATAVTLSAANTSNAGGVISGLYSASVQGGAINNDGGVIESGAGGIYINTNGQLLNNTNSGSTGGIVSKGQIDIVAGDLNNASGYIGSNAILSITASGNINNQGGEMFGGTGLYLRPPGDLNNSNGKITSGANASIEAGSLINQAGLVFAAGNLSVNAASIDNSNTNNGGFNLGLLAGGNLSVSAGNINNSTGAMVGLGSASITASGQLNNSAGQIAGGTAHVQAAQVINTGGRIDASRALDLRSPQTSADGVIASSGTLALAFSGDYTNTGTVSANGNLSITTNGNYNNQGIVSANQALNLTASNLNNASGAQINASQTTLNIAGSVSNQGLINSTAGPTQITTGSLSNTGQLFGGSVGISGSVSNSAGGVIASRSGDLTINGSLTNSGGAEVLSLASMSLNGPVTNIGSRISADGNLSFGGALSNLNAGLVLGTETVTSTVPGDKYIVINGVRYNATKGEVVLNSVGRVGSYALPSSTYPFAKYGGVPIAGPITSGPCSGTGEDYRCGPDVYLADPLDPRWALFNVTPPTDAGLVPLRPEPAVQGGCSYIGYSNEGAPISLPIQTGVCGVWWSEVDAYTLAMSTRLTTAINQLTRAINQFNADLEIRSKVDWTEQQVTGSTITKPTVVFSQPGQVLAGGNISLAGGLNHDSIIVAGGAITGGFGMNVTTQATQTTTEDADQRTSRQITNCSRAGCWFSSSVDRENSLWQPIALPPVTKSVPVTITVNGVEVKTARQDPFTAPGGNVPPANPTPPLGAPAIMPAIMPAIGAAAGTSRSPTLAANDPTNASPTPQTVNGPASVSTQAGPAALAATTPGGSVNLGSLVIASATAVSGATSGSTTPLKLGNGPTTPLPGSVIATEVRTNQALVAGQQLAQFGQLAAALPIAVQVQPVIVAASTPTGAAAPTAGNAAAPLGAAKALQGTGPNAPTLASISGINQPTAQVNRALAAPENVVNPSAPSTNITRTPNPAAVKGLGYTSVTTAGRLSAPASQLFAVLTAPGASYLVETNPAFTNNRAFLSSNYFLAQLGLDPERSMKRYGDGFAEQRLVAEQILNLTGRKFVTNTTDNEQQYLDLLNAGVMYAKQFNLSPGIALSAEQMAALTTDIVWLQSQTITLADGSTVQALVPQVYLRRPTAGDLQPTGALISGNSIDLRLPGGETFTNSGTLLANTSLNINAQDINNSGTIAGNRISLTAAQDINNVGGQITAVKSADLNAGRDITLASTTQTTSRTITGPGGTSTGSATRVDRIATVQADTITLAALGNINLTGAQVKANNNLNLDAKRDITASAIEQSYTLNTPNGQSGKGASYYNTAATSQFASNSAAGNNANLNAGGAATVNASNLSAGNNLSVNASSISIKAGIDSSAADQRMASNKSFQQNAQTSQTLSGANITAGNNATLIAKDKIDVAGGNLVAGSESNKPLAQVNQAQAATNTGANTGQLSLIAGGPITIAGITTTQTANSSSASSSSGFFSSKSSSSQSASSQTLQAGSSVGGNTVLVQSGQDITVKGSSVIADKAVELNASGNITLAATTNKSSNTSFSQSKESGLLSGGSGLSISIGSRQQSTDQNGQSISAVASTVGSVTGNVQLTAGQSFKQVGSDVQAPKGDITITAKDVQIIEARETTASALETKFKQSALTISLSSPITSAVSQAQGMAQAASNTGDARMKALAAGSAALNWYNNADAISKSAQALASADPLNAFTINASLGTSKSQSSQSAQTDSAKASTLTAGNNISINASGAGKDSNLVVQGSTVTAGNSAEIKADNQINLQAAQNTASQTSSNSNSSASVGVSYNFATQAVGVSASASKGQGSGNGQDTSYTNTTVTAGNQATITSGGDTNLKGAVVTANQIKADVGTSGQGNLNIQSLQDTSTFTSQQSSAGGSISLGGGSVTGGSLSAGKSNLGSTFQSVNQQSGLKAGGGGFQVTVNNNTDLKGGVIASTQAAIDNNKNTFTTAGSLTTTDLQNQASFKGQASGISIDVGKQDGKFGVAGVGVGLGSDKGDAASTSTAGISGIAGNTAVRTGDAETGLQKIFNAEKVQREINAQVAITQAFTKEAPKAVAKFSDGQIADLNQALAKETDETKRTAIKLDIQKWQEGGAYRVALHTLTGALGGGVSGAAGAATSASAAPLLNDLQDGVTSTLQKAGLSDTAAKGIASTIAGLTAAGVGAVAGGGQGAATALTVDTNNRQLHPTERQWARDNATKYRDLLASKTGEKISTEEAYQRLLSAGYAITDTGAANTGKSDETAKQFINQNSGSLFNSTAAQRTDPLLNGNPDGSFTPEQQARYGVKSPTELANKRIEVANQYTGKPCGITSCTDKVDAVAGAISALEQEKALYQNDPARVRQIEIQQNQLISGLSKQDIERAQLANADAAFMMDLLMLPQASGLINGISKAAMLNKVVARVEAGAAVSGGAATGTVFDSIKATQPFYPGSVIPRSFEMTLPNGKSVWVAGNATEHIAEFAQMKAINFTPEAVRLASQEQLASLQGAINTATQNGVAYNQMLNVGGWELKFAPPRPPGQLPSLIHALQKR